MVIYAAVEGGGQSWVCALASNSPDNIIEQAEFATTSSPLETLGLVRDWLRARHFDAVGVASFGPIDPRPLSPSYGFITSTPKEGWTNTDVLGLLDIRSFNKPFFFDTDVNAPALSEYLSYREEASQISPSSSLLKASSSCAYITIGTGVGVGLVVNGRTVHGALHPEAGHVRVGRQVGDDAFRGICRFHRDCVEGMCSSVAIAARAQVRLADLPALPDDHPVWDTTAYYIAALCANLLLIASLEKIVLGGGVMNRTCLYAKIRKHLVQILNHYLQIEGLKDENIDSFISPSKWGSKAGIIGALYLAKTALDTSHSTS